MVWKSVENDMDPLQQAAFRTFAVLLDNTLPSVEEEEACSVRGGHVF